MVTTAEIDRELAALPVGETELRGFKVTRLPQLKWGSRMTYFRLEGQTKTRSYTRRSLTLELVKRLNEEEVSSGSDC